jgi:phage major head subunit gpT-like protein
LLITRTNLETLRTGFKTDFQAGIALASPVADALATPVNSTTKVETYGFLGDLPIFREWVGEKRIKSIEEKSYQLINRDFETTLGIHKKKIEDDNLGLYAPMVQGWGQDAGQLKDSLLFEALAKGHQNPCFDGQNFFDDEHPMGDDLGSNISGDNSTAAWFLVDLSKPLKPLLYQDRKKPSFAMVTDPEDSHVFKTGEFLMGGEARGAAGYTLWQLAHRCTGALNAANYDAALTAMAELKNDEGEPLGIRPTHLVHGTSTRAAAKTLIKAQNMAGGASNINYQDVELIEARRLP